MSNHSSIPTSTPHASRSQEWRVLLVVAIVLAMTELAMVKLEVGLSKDILHLRSFSSIATRLDSKSPDASTIPPPTRVLLVGNSLVREGLVPEVMRDVAEQSLGHACVIERIHPDNTALAEWFYAIDRFVLQAEIRPDAIMIGFQGGHLRDAPTRHAERLKRFYCNANQRDSLARYDLKGLESWLFYEINGTSAALCNRDRVERKVLDQCIPNYRVGIQLLNSWQQPPPAPDSIPTFHRLTDLIHRIRSRGIQVILIEIPIANPVPLDPQLTEAIDTLHIPLIQFKGIDDLPTEAYSDGLHLNRAAAEIVSRNIANQIDWQSLETP